MIMILIIKKGKEKIIKKKDYILPLRKENIDDKIIMKNKNSLIDFNYN